MSETRILLWKMTNGSIKDEENWKRIEKETNNETDT